ncbi:Uncharacterised protein [Vibrio cholerae]|nr:Uncharacterised protein [Vibrio cholerae]
MPIDILECRINHRDGALRSASTADIKIIYRFITQ